MSAREMTRPAANSDGMASLSGHVWGEVCASYPEMEGFLVDLGLAAPASDDDLCCWIDELDDNQLDELAMDRQALAAVIAEQLERLEMARSNEGLALGSLEIVGGTAKDGSSEKLDIKVAAGEVVCIVGPTGSGKSRLLCDIECLAQGDTPTHRMVRVDGRCPNDDERFSSAEKLVAQLSQSMCYVLELGVAEFLDMHARSRKLRDADTLVDEVIAAANRLCGEPFDGDEPICLLSGGQSRALMIADVALLSRSPVVLIDELENAGVDKRAALDLLMQEGKIVFIATHDPLLMLLGTRRIVMSGGAVACVRERTASEEKVLESLEAYENEIDDLRNRLRAGDAAVVLLHNPVDADHEDDGRR